MKRENGRAEWKVKRWIGGYERIGERAAALPDTRLVDGADREADPLALMQRSLHSGILPMEWRLLSNREATTLAGAAEPERRHPPYRLRRRILRPQRRW